MSVRRILVIVTLVAVPLSGPTGAALADDQPTGPHHAHSREHDHYKHHHYKHHPHHDDGGGGGGCSPFC
jgi:hypothetical protein